VTLQVLGCGLHPIGIAVPVTPTERIPPPGIAAEAYAIDGSRDVESLSTSQDPVDAQVQLAMVALRGSGAAIAELGQRFGDLRKLGDDFEALAESEARAALQRLVKNGDITIDSVVVTKGADWGEVTVNYFNLRRPREAERRERLKFSRRF
jgi:hypothetical protein